MKESINEGQAMRMNAESMLKEKIKQEERHTQALKILQNKISWKTLTTEEDEILWSYFLQTQHR